MDTIKTAFVVALLLAVLYGVYVVLNKEPATPPPEVAEMLEDIDDEEMLGPAIDSGTEAEEAITEVPPAGQEFVDLPPKSFDQFQTPEPQRGNENPARADQYRPTESDSESPAGTEDSLPYVPDEGSSYGAPLDASTNAGTNAYDSTNDTYNDSARYPSDPGSVDLPDADQGPAPTEPQLEEAVEQPSVDSTAAGSIEGVLQEAQSQIGSGEFAQALVTASAAYTVELGDEQRRQLQDLLDPLAAKVIYSREHLLAQPYTARGDETLMQIAAEHQVPWQLLQNINGIENPNVLLSGTVLKVVQGPFRAEVDTERGELTLYLQQMYAGRFPITIGNNRPMPKDYMVMSKETDRPYYMADGSIIPANDPKNPYGDVWIDLGEDRLGIHSSASAGPTDAGMGCISLSPRDARDVFGILSEGSRVTVVR